MANRPETMFTWSDGWALGYQVFGEGPDLLYLPPFVSSIDMMWSSPHYARFLRRLASFSRVCAVDRRGWGTSDRFEPGTTPDLAQLVDDLSTIKAVANLNTPTLLAAQETGFVAIEAAAIRPGAFAKLILFQSSPVWTEKDDMPWESSEARTDALIRSFALSTSWADWNRTFVRDELPSMAGDQGLIDWLAIANRGVTSPGALVSELGWLRTIDLRHRLSEIHVPTMLLSRPEQGSWSHESMVYMAERIPESLLVELPGADVYPWTGEWEAITDEIQAFVTGSRERAPSRRSLATVLFTDVVGSTAQAVELGDTEWRLLLERHNDLLRGLLRHHGGNEVGTSGDGFFATFETPVGAVRCALDATRGVRDLGMEIRAGVHTGEVEFDGEDLRGVAIHIGARVMATAGASEVLVSSTVRDLVTGSGLTFEDAGEHDLKGVPDTWRLYRVVSG